MFIGNSKLKVLKTAKSDQGVILLGLIIPMNFGELQSLNIHTHQIKVVPALQPHQKLQLKTLSNSLGFPDRSVSQCGCSEGYVLFLINFIMWTTIIL